MVAACAALGGGCVARVSAEPAAGVHMVGSEHVLERAVRQPEGWYGSAEARGLADVIVSWQNANGGVVEEV